eukprot:297637-Hanusia_phi.AAC.2
MPASCAGKVERSELYRRGRLLEKEAVSCSDEVRGNSARSSSALLRSSSPFPLTRPSSPLLLSQSCI